jgi:tetratricopeptide (TPR) repeat protein
LDARRLPERGASVSAAGRDLKVNFRPCINTSTRVVLELIVRLLAVLGMVTASSLVCAGQAADESQMYEKLHYGLQRALVAYTEFDFSEAKQELDETLSLLQGNRTVENAVLESRLQRLRGDVASLLKEDAEEHYRKALDALDRSEAVWIEHRADTQAALGMFLIERGRTNEAIDIAAKTIEDVKAVLGDDANEQYFLSSYRTIAIANLVDGNFEKALSAQALAIDAFGKPRETWANSDFSAMDALWYASIQLEAGDFDSALNGFVETFPKLGQGSQDQCHAFTGILITAEEPRAGATGLAAREVLQSWPNDIDIHEYLANCLSKGAAWTLTGRFYHQHFWFIRMWKKVKQ